MHVSRERLDDARRKFVTETRSFFFAPHRDAQLIDEIAEMLFNRAIMLAGDCETNEEMDLAANVLRAVSQYTRNIMERERARRNDSD